MGVLVCGRPVISLGLIAMQGIKEYVRATVAWQADQQAKRDELRELVADGEAQHQDHLDLLHQGYQKQLEEVCCCRQ